MGSIKPLDLSTLIANLAIDSINTQLRFNAAHEIDIKNYQALVAAADPNVKQFLGPLLPSRMHLDTFELDLSIVLTVEKSQALSIQALPIGLGFSILHQARTERRTRINLSVKQYPIPDSDVPPLPQ